MTWVFKYLVVHFMFGNMYIHNTYSGNIIALDEHLCVYRNIYSNLEDLLYTFAEECPDTVADGFESWAYCSKEEDGCTIF